MDVNILCAKGDTCGIGYFLVDVYLYIGFYDRLHFVDLVHNVSDSGM